MQMEVNLIPPLKTATNRISICLRPLPSPLHSILMLNLGAEHAYACKSVRRGKFGSLPLKTLFYTVKVLKGKYVSDINSQVFCLSPRNVALWQSCVTGCSVENGHESISALRHLANELT